MSTVLIIVEQRLTTAEIEQARERLKMSGPSRPVAKPVLIGKSAT